MTELNRDQRTRIAGIIAAELAALRDAAIAAGTDLAVVVEVFDRRRRALAEGRQA